MKKDMMLTTNEKTIMDLFWACNRPLTSVDLVQMCAEHEWSQEYILLVLKNISKKGLLKEVGYVRISTKRARQFVPAITKEEYAAGVALATGIGPESFSRTALAIAEGMGEKGEIIERLEALIQELKEQVDE